MRTANLAITGGNPERRIPIVLNKPDPSIIHDAQYVHREGFVNFDDDWLTAFYPSVEEAKLAFETRGKRELSAIHAALLMGVEEKVKSKEPERPPYGLVIPSTLNSPPKPTSLIPKDTTTPKKERRERYYDQTFWALTAAMSTTYSDGIRENLIALAQEGLADPSGKAASVFDRLEKISWFNARLKPDSSGAQRSGFEIAYQGLRGNLLAGTYGMSSVLKIIPLMAEDYGFPVNSLEEEAGTFLQQIAKNSRRFIMEQTLMDTRVSREVDIWLEILKKTNPFYLEFFQLSPLNNSFSLDFSDRFKMTIHTMEQKLEESPHHFGCAAAHPAPGERSLVNTIWDRYVDLSLPVYNYFFGG